METTPSPESPAIKPALWNPTAAALWSILFSPVFGSFLHARNAEALHRNNEAAANWRWFYGSGAFMLLYTVAGIYFPEFFSVFSTTIALAYVCLWHFLTGRHQEVYVKRTYGRDYVKKEWFTPLMIGLVGLVVFFFLNATIAAICAALIG